MLLCSCLQLAPAATKRSFASPRTLVRPVAPTAVFTLRQRTPLFAAMSSQDPLFEAVLDYGELVEAGVTGLGMAS